MRMLISAASPTLTCGDTVFPPRNGVRVIAVTRRVNNQPEKHDESADVIVKSELARMCWRAASMAKLSSAPTVCFQKEPR